MWSVLYLSLNPFNFVAGLFSFVHTFSPPMCIYFFSKRHHDERMMKPTLCLRTFFHFNLFLQVVIYFSAPFRSLVIIKFDSLCLPMHTKLSSKILSCHEFEHLLSGLPVKLTQNMLRVYSRHAHTNTEEFYIQNPHVFLLIGIINIR